MDSAQADLALADAFWWLQGFTSAQPMNLEAAAACQRIAQVRRWLQSLTAGDAIIVSADANDDDRMGWRASISQAQFERLFDGLRSDAADADRADGRLCAEELLASIRHRRESLINPDVPF